MDVQVADLSNQVAQLQQQLQMTVAASEARMDELRLATQRDKKSSLEPRQLNRPKEFNGSEKDWHEFAMKFENWFVGLHGQARVYFRWVETQSTQIDPADAEAPDQLSEETLREMSRQLYLSP